jgi:hypothetical protein
VARPRDWDQAAIRLGLTYEPGGWTRRYRLSGALDGLAVEVASSEQDYGDSTEYAVSFPPLGLGLSLQQGRPLRGLGRRLRQGAAAEITGNPEFDRAVNIKGTDPARLALFLDAGRQAAVLRLFEEYPRARISDDRICWSSSRLDRAERLEARLRGLVDTAKLLSH